MKVLLGASVGIPCSGLHPADIDGLKNHLTLIKKQSTTFAFQKEVKEEIVFMFKLEGDLMVVPRSFGLEYASKKGLEVDDRRSVGDAVSIVFNEAEQGKNLDLKKQQDGVVANVVAGLHSRDSNSGILQAGTGCHAAGQLILMADGTKKKAEDIVVGDLLMGADGARRVLTLHRGRQRMARIVPMKGDPFVVNVEHILSLVWSGTHGARKHGDLFDVTVAQWLASSRRFKAYTKLYRSRVDRFFTSYTDADRPVHPYVLGILLGDGSIGNSPSVTTLDKEVVSVVRRLARDLGLRIRRDSSGGRCPTYHINSGIKFTGRNKLTSIIKKLGLYEVACASKFVPRAYLVASRKHRLDLLAGLLDTDGSLIHGGFDFISKSKQLAEDVVFLCRSLGLAAYLKRCRKSCQTGAVGTYYRVSISGDCSIIPTRVFRKQAARRKQIKDVQRTGFSVRLLKEADYYGFVVDKDHRYLLGDFTVTHNTGKTLMGIKTICEIGRRALICVHSEFLMSQWKKEIFKFTDLKEEDIGYLWQEHRDLDKKIVIGMIQTIIRRDFTQEERKSFGMILFDEVQHLPAEAFSQAMHKFDAKYLLGLSATPKRFDGLDTLLTHGLGTTLNSNVMGTRLIPEIYFVKNSVDIPPASYMQRVRFPGGKEKTIAHLGKLTVLLAKMASRNQLVVNLIKKAAEKGRKIMVFSGRREHLRMLQKLVAAAVPSCESALFMGGMTPKQEEAAKLAQIMFCTYQYASEALNVPDRDCLIMATPITSVKQPIGRILRPADNKKQPIVVDILDDTVPSLMRMAQSRTRQYKELRATVNLPNGQSIK